MQIHLHMLLKSWSEKFPLHRINNQRTFEIIYIIFIHVFRGRDEQAWYVRLIGVRLHGASPPERS